MINPALILASGLFFLAVSAALYVLAWLSAKILLRLAPDLPPRATRCFFSACLFSPFLIAVAFTASGAFLHHRHTAGETHGDAYCGDIARLLALPEGKLPVVIGLAMQGAAWLLLAWGVFTVLRLWHTTILLERSLSPYLQPPSKKLAATLAKIQTEHNFARLKFFEADIPMAYSCLIGILRVRCVISRELIASSTCQELEAVAMHEISHFRSGDVWRTLLVGTLDCLFCFLRPVGAIARRWREETEIACDAATAYATREPLALASAILRTQGTRIQTRSLPNATLGFARERACSPEKRVERLLAYAQGEPVSHDPARARKWQWAITTVLAVLGVMFLLSPQAMCISHCSLEAISHALH